MSVSAWKTVATVQFSDDEIADMDMLYEDYLNADSEIDYCIHEFYPADCGDYVNGCPCECDYCTERNC